VTYLSPLLITICTTADGLYSWELHDGPDGAFEESGREPTIDRCISAITRARRAIADHFTDNPDPAAFRQPNLPLYEPPAHIHPPGGAPLPAQQDIPSPSHSTGSSDFIYPHPSKSG
jgi:hypothetical protein